MSDGGESTKTLQLLILSINQEMGESFLLDVCDEAVGGSGSLALDGISLKAAVLAGDPRLNPSWDESVRKADAMVLLSRFMDVLSLDKIKAVYRRLPSDKTVPLGVFIYRETEETDYKMSCPACGQKLWVRDSDVGKRGRCPNCKKAFKLPSQTNLIKSQLMLPDSVGIQMTLHGDKASCRKAVTDLVGRVAGTISPAGEGGAVDLETLKKTTVRVQVSPEDIEEKKDA